MSWFSFILYFINFGSIISLVFLQRKDMSVTFAWLLILIFIPGLGFLLYFFFGSTSKLELLTKKYRMTVGEKEYNTQLQRAYDLIKEDDIVFEDRRMEKYRDMILINTKNAGSFVTEDNYVELLVNGQEKFPRMFEDIRKAKDTINVMYFIIKSQDEIGKQFINLLAEKAAEGVTVRLLYDGMGCLKTRLKDFDPIVRNGGVVQRFLPSVIRTLLEVNYRLHRKMVVIDGKVCYTGGINVGDDYMGKDPVITPWRDTSVRIRGTAVKELQLLFFKDWVFCAKQNKRIKERVKLTDIKVLESNLFPVVEQAGGMGVQVIQCGPDQKYAVHKDTYVKMCTSARDYLYIQSPYFVPDQTLLDAIRMAAQSGVDVRLMIPGVPDKWYVYKVAMSYLEELMEAGVRIYAYKGFIHAKTIVADGYISSVGTTNLDIRSFKLDYEVNTLVYSEEFARDCTETFFKDIACSRQFVLEKFKQRGPWEKFVESICRFIAPLA